MFTEFLKIYFLIPLCRSAKYKIISPYCYFIIKIVLMSNKLDLKSLFWHKKKSRNKIFYKKKGSYKNNLGEM